MRDALVWLMLTIGAMGCDEKTAKEDTKDAGSPTSKGASGNDTTEPLRNTASDVCKHLMNAGVIRHETSRDLCETEMEGRRMAFAEKPQVWNAYSDCVLGAATENAYSACKAKHLGQP